jgi:hypothetical protein
MSPAPRKPPADDDGPTSIWAWERRRRQLDESQSIEDEIPRLPSTSPWATGIDQATGPEPPLNEET